MAVAAARLYMRLISQHPGLGRDLGKWMKARLRRKAKEANNMADTTNIPIIGSLHFARLVRCRLEQLREVNPMEGATDDAGAGPDDGSTARSLAEAAGHSQLATLLA